LAWFKKFIIKLAINFYFKICVFILDQDEQSASVVRMALDFEIPKNFMHPEKYVPTKIREDAFDDVPRVVAEAIFEAIGLEVPLDPMTIFLYLKTGRLPEFVIAYFMQFELPKRKVTKMYLFYRALHLANMFRESVLVPQPHFLSEVLDTASVQAVGRRAGEAGVSISGNEPGKEEEKEGDEEQDVGVPEEDDDEPVLVIDEDRVEEEDE